LIHFYKRVDHRYVKIALAATITTIAIAKMSSSSSEAESPDIKPRNPDNVRGATVEKEKPGPSTEDREDTAKEGAEEPGQEEGSRWRKMYNKTAFTFTSSRDSAAAAAAARKEAAAQKLRATQESIIASKNAAAEAAWAKKEAATKAAYEKKEAAAAAAKARKDAAAAKIWEAGEAAKTSTNNATSAVKSSTGNAAASVSTGFWGVVDMAKKAAVDPKSMLGRASDKITIIHFNDVADTEARDSEPCGGAARFMAAINKNKEDGGNPLVVFSGNAFSPSMTSTYTKGEHMVSVLNMLGTQFAIFGNHDFDYGLDVFMERKEKSDFPWIISNVIDTESGQPLGGGKVHHILEWEGRKLGIIGLVEREWLDTVSSLDRDHLDYTDYADAASMLAEELKKKGCEYIIAVTHMRTDNDVRLAEKVPEVNLILGGHSQVYEKRKVNGVYILKSGSDFRQFSKITLDFKEKEIEIECVEVTKEIEPDEEMVKKLEEYKDVEAEAGSQVLAKLGSDLDGRFKTVRNEEANLGNLLADVAMAALQADCALLNAGTIKSNTKHAKGEFKLKDLLSILPTIDSLVLIDVKGSQIHQALENGVAAWPKLDAKFPQVGGITFAFDPSKAPGSRIDPAFIKIGSEYMDKDQHYKMATKAALASGEEGYTALSQGVVLIDDQCGPSLTAAMLNHFKAVGLKKLKDDEETGAEVVVSVHQQCLVTRSCYHKDREISKRINTAAKLRPKADGRIQQQTPEVLAKLKEEKEVHKSGSGKKKSKHRTSSPKDEAREALFDSPNKKTNGVNGSSKSKSKKASEVSDDLK